MIKKTKQPLSSNDKINLIPLMDAVFIFIFFLLGSSDLTSFKEIGTSIPIVKNTDSFLKDGGANKEQLKIKIKASYESVVVYINDKVKKRVGLLQNSNLKVLTDFLVDLKNKNPNQDKLIIKPDKRLKYKDLIKVIDASQVDPKGRVELNSSKNVKKSYMSSHLIFSNIAVEPIQ